MKKISKKRRNNEFKVQPGDIVKLNQIMTVINMKDKAIECGWFDHNQKFHSYVSRKEDLIKIIAF